jgi:hypothetical protein
MAINRDAIYEALSQRMQTRTTGFQTFQRKYVDYTQVPAGDQPALIVIEGDQDAMHSSPSLPTKWNLQAILVVYARTTDQVKPGSTLLNLIDSVEAALERQPGEGTGVFANAQDERFTTLGGLVRRAWIGGRVQVDPGPEGEQGIAIIPVEILVDPK